MMETTNAFTDDDDDDDAADASSSSSSASSSSSSSTLNSWIDFAPLGRKSIRTTDRPNPRSGFEDEQTGPAGERRGSGTGVVSKAHECASRREHKGKAEGEECTPTDAFRRFNYRILEVESE